MKSGNLSDGRRRPGPVWKSSDLKPHNSRFCSVEVPFGLIWLSSACSLRSVCLPPVPVENMYHTGQEISGVADTTPSAPAGSNLCRLFPVGAQVSVCGANAYWVKYTMISTEGHLPVNGQRIACPCWIYQMQRDTPTKGKQRFAVNYIDV